MAYFHGVSTRQLNNSVAVPTAATSGITFAVGTAPIHTVESGKLQTPVCGQDYAKTVAQLGYSEDWRKFSLCEVMFSHFRIFATKPVFFVNVLNPDKHKKTVAPAEFMLADKRVLLVLEAIKSSVAIDTYKEGEDFKLFYEGEHLVLEVIEGGSIPENTASLRIGFDVVAPDMVSEEDIIGGFDVGKKVSTGLELINAVFPMFAMTPDIIIAPGWSCKKNVAAVMAAKAQAINGLFRAKALIDVDTKTVKHFGDVPQWKAQNKISDERQALCYPMGKVGTRIFHLSSLLAGLIAQVDNENGDCPAESPSNKKIRIDSTVLEDGTEERLDITQANYLNSKGIITAINFTGGFTLWGNEMACFPEVTEVKKRFISVSRMFDWVENSVILTYWSKVDGKLNRLLIDSIVDSCNIWLNGLTAEEKLLGGRIEYRADENPNEQMEAGKLVFHIFLTPASPAQEIEFILEYDLKYMDFK